MKLVASRKPEKKKHQPHSTLPKEKYTFYLIKSNDYWFEKSPQGNMHHFFVGIYISSSSYVTDKIKDINNLLKKFSSVIYRMLVNLSIINVPINL